MINSYRHDMSIEEAAELARRAIYHATFRDGASGGVASGMFTFSFLFSWLPIHICNLHLASLSMLVYLWVPHSLLK